MTLSYEDHEGGADAVLDRLAARVSPRILEAPARLDAVRRELDEYFAGARTRFDVPLDWALAGPFARRILTATAAIPFGEVRSYAQVATEAGSPRGSRAAGNALGVQPDADRRALPPRPAQRRGARRLHGRRRAQAGAAAPGGRPALTAWQGPGMAPVFLIGGGRDEDAVRASHAPFVRAAGGGPIVALVLDGGEDTDPARWTGALALAGASEASAVVVSPARPPHAADLAGAAGVFVAGGWTPGYQEALVAAGTGWLPAGVPYAGFSAGAAIAGREAIVGGWRVNGIAVCPEDAGEDLDELQPRPGLALVEFAVDVHAAQWGTLGRLVRAVSAGLVESGWAIDEGTVLVAGDGAPRVEGLGSAWRVERDASGRTTVAVLGS